MLYKPLGAFLVSAFIIFLFCEYLAYFFILYQCSWPEIFETERDEQLSLAEQQNLKVIFLADTHLLGIRKGHWFDKLRREWQMYISFQTILALHEPEVIFILGDVFDEASFSPDKIYYAYVKRFFELFNVGNKTELLVIPGNHDIGFHYAMHPYLVRRFSETFNTSSIRMITRKNNHFVLVNSMALEKDGCDLCRHAEEQIRQITNKFRCSNGTILCSRGMKQVKYSRPVILLHFPLFRENDAHCTGFTSAPNYLKFDKFKEKWDCLSKKATSYLLDNLHPRTVFSGHTHHACQTLHKTDIWEFTVPSFNWRNKPNPSFIMAVFNADKYAIHWCYLPHEYFIIAIYVFSVFTILIMFIYLRTRRKSAATLLKKNF